MESKLEQRINKTLTFIDEALGKAILLITLIATGFEVTHWVAVFIARQFY